jgi:four helix bundle protein
VAYYSPEILQKRLANFANRCRRLILKLPRTEYNIIYGKQLIRSSSSPGANYIEAIEASSSKEFLLRLKICRKEMKESGYWLDLIKESNESMITIKENADVLINEAGELTKISAASIITSERNQKISKLENEAPTTSQPGIFSRCFVGSGIPPKRKLFAFIHSLTAMVFCEGG